MRKTVRATPPAAMSIDVEDWFQVQNLQAGVPRDTWETQERRVERNTDRMLQLLADAGARGTCFILGWVAERHPKLIKRIAAQGHEIASHGWGHELVYEIGPDRFRKDVGDSKRLLEDLTGERVHGYRAPNFSICDWALDVLVEQGYTYDSSSFPVVAHDRYGRLSNAPAGKPIYEARAGLTEVCVSVLDFAGRGLPWGGGGYFRMLPYPLFRRGVRRILDKGVPYVFYIHPWEIDPGQPRVKGLKWQHAFRHYVNLAACEGRWAQLLRDFQWTTVQDLLDRVDRGVTRVTT
jgi:polysaccharide deacetylase family protein (PEP-CTERM system associated)